MRLSLARFNDDQGRSAGWWLVRQLPGTYLQRKEEGWLIEQMSLTFTITNQGRSSQFAHVWGEHWEVHSLPGYELMPYYGSRGEALMALETAVSGGEPPTISQLI